MQMQINEIEELYNKIPQQVIVNINTQLDQFQLGHSQLELSTDLDQEQLNHMIKMMLNQSTPPRFQFIVEGFLLRGKLKSHILRHELTPEQTLNIQYIIAFPQLQHQQNNQTQEWISSIKTVEGPEGISGVVASLYDGSIAVFSSKLQKIGTFSADQDPLKACSFIPSEKQNHYFCLSGGMGQLLQVHLTNITENTVQSQLLSSNPHEGSVTCIQASPGSDNHIATGGELGQLNIWQIPNDFSQTLSHNTSKNKKKKVELSLNVLPKLASEQIHKGNIQSLNWITNQEIVSSSSSHQIAITDVVKMTRAQTIHTRDSVPTSLDTYGNQILSSHQDGQIRMWDRRQPSRPTQTYKAHSKWASCVSFRVPSNIFASGSYDHTVKIWDSRCGFPIQNLHSEEEKVLAIEWLDSSSIVSGGSDSSLHLYKTK